MRTLITKDPVLRETNIQEEIAFYKAVSAEAAGLQETANQLLEKAMDENRFGREYIVRKEFPRLHLKRLWISARIRRLRGESLGRTIHARKLIPITAHRKIPEELWGLISKYSTVADELLILTDAKRRVWSNPDNILIAKFQDNHGSRYYVLSGWFEHHDFSDFQTVVRPESIFKK